MVVSLAHNGDLIGMGRMVGYRDGEEAGGASSGKKKRKKL